MHECGWGLPAVRASEGWGETTARGVGCWGGAKAHLLSGGGPGPAWGSALVREGLEQWVDRG